MMVCPGIGEAFERLPGFSLGSETVPEDVERPLGQMSGAASKLPFLKALVETESAARREMIIRVAC
jgi:hypothetical protein